MTLRAFRIRAVLFDFDGTLTRPGDHDWAGFKEEIGCPADVAALEYIQLLTDPDRRRRAEAALDRFEMAAANRSVPARGAADLIAELKAKNMALGILTRNSRRALLCAMSRFDAMRPEDFDLLITRETVPNAKPSPDGVLHAARRWKINPEELLVIGDYVFDIEAGHRAGAVTVLIDSTARCEGLDIEPDFRISCLSELMAVARLGMPISGGKLPNDLLESFLKSLPQEDKDLLIYPAVGQDIAAVNVQDGVLVLKSDPITLVSDAFAEYAVIVNANDIATAGAEPQWFLSTLLFPSGTTPSMILRLMEDLHAVCRRYGIVLCGGHTEVTDAVNRPVVSGMLCGTVEAGRLVDKRNMKSGDRLLMTKQIAVEGTAIIAREFGDRLQRQGISSETLEAAAGLLSRISILPEARIAADFAGVSAMHDVTEGGVATAVEEFSVAGGHRLRVQIDQLRFFPATLQLCRATGIDPLGLIGSGSLLIACRPDRAEALNSALEAAGIEAALIGEALCPGRGVEAREKGAPAPWPTFEADELTRLF
jgi:HAD superfamily hydrolase (TIGR01509 family)